MRAELYWIAKTWPGKLAVFPRPRGGDWLPDEVQVASRLADLLKEGKNVGIHCRQGVGRASLVTACALTQISVNADAAFALIGQARGLAVPETAEQERWVKEFWLAHGLQPQ